MQKPHHEFFCPYDECGRRFKRISDRRRHENSKHKGSGYLCGDCEIEGKQSTIKRKDHMPNHLQTQHGCEKKDWGDIKLCSFTSCRAANQMLAFSSQTNLNTHVRQKHDNEIIDLLSPSSDKPDLSVTRGK